MISSDDKLCWRLFQLNWLPIGGMGVVLFGAVAFSGFSIAPISFGVMVALAGALAAAAYRESRRGAPEVPRRVLLPGAAAQVILVTIMAGPLSYVLAAIGSFFPLQDYRFLAIDAALGYDSRQIITFVNDHKWLATVLALGYGMIKWPLLCVPVILSMAGRSLRMQQYMIALSIALIATLLLSIFVPAIGTYDVLKITAADVPNIDLRAFSSLQRDLPAVRSGLLRTLDLLELAGIVAFPSFHAASAILFTWALRPIRIIGPAALAINALMLASTPIMGGHFLVDVLGGLAIASGSILAAGFVTRTLSCELASLGSPHIVPAE